MRFVFRLRHLFELVVAARAASLDHGDPEWQWNGRFPRIAPTRPSTALCSNVPTRAFKSLIREGKVFAVSVCTLTTALVRRRAHSVLRWMAMLTMTIGVPLKKSGKIESKWSGNKLKRNYHLTQTIENRTIRPKLTRFLRLARRIIYLWLRKSAPRSWRLPFVALLAAPLRARSAN
jgi:hypothetical protein